jgi:hypothetical protein
MSFSGAHLPVPSAFLFKETEASRFKPISAPFRGTLISLTPISCGLSCLSGTIPTPAISDRFAGKF